MIEPGFYNTDCMKGMSQFPDKYFDLAIVDPPYGIGYDTAAAKNNGKHFGTMKGVRGVYHAPGWDTIPDEAYFRELFRVSKQCIIWGGNYFTEFLPPSKGFICWDKRLDENMRNDWADCEYAWLSEGLGVARMFRYLWNGMLQGNMKNKESRIHPTQKPVALYKWLLQHYAKPGDIILDTHVGSASSLIACEDLGFDYVGFEIDETYFKLAKQRMDEYNAQLRMF